MVKVIILLFAIGIVFYLKQPMICLDSNTRGGAFQVEKGKRYDLVVHFKSATGSYCLNWDERETNGGGQTEWN